MIEKIISGRQTGAGRAALDVAIELGMHHGGWIQKTRRAEDGKYPDKYKLQETNLIGNHFGLWSANWELMASFRFVAGKMDIDEKDIIKVIIRELWKRLKEFHRSIVVS